MKFLTAAIMVKNESANIGRAIDSIKRAGCFSDILVMDTGSTDDTPATAARHGARVIVPENLEDFFIDTDTGRHFNFSAGRNRLHEESTGEWLLHLDADEELSGNCAGLVAFLKKLPPEIDMVALMFRDMRPGDRQHMQFPQPRIFRRARVKWENIVHNKPKGFEPAIMYPEVSVLHWGYGTGDEARDAKVSRTYGLLKKQLEIDPASWWAYFYLSQHYGDIGELEKCIEASETYLAHRNDVEHFNTSVYFTLCQAAMLTKKYDLVDRWLGEAIKELPGDIDIAAIVFDFGMQTNRPAVVLSGANMYLKAWDTLQENALAMGSRFTYTNQQESLGRVLYQIVAMRLDESIKQLERLMTVLPKFTDEEKKAQIERQLDSTMARLGVRWTHNDKAGPQKEAA